VRFEVLYGYPTVCLSRSLILAGGSSGGMRGWRHVLERSAMTDVGLVGEGGAGASTVSVRILSAE